MAPIVTFRIASLPSGAPITQYGTRAPITLDSAGLGFPQNYGRAHGWTDTTTPRTDRPVRFYRATSRIVGATHPTVWSYVA